MEKSEISILVTGSNGFIGKNLCLYLESQGYSNILKCDINTDKNELDTYLEKCRYIFHLAGVNRPNDKKEFYAGNSDLTERICKTLIDKQNFPTIIMSSSIQADLDNDYGKSKKIAEDTIFVYSQTTGAPSYIFRLPNVFGKWCKPNYNSVVATFCDQIANNKPISIDDPNKQIDLIYIDDIVKMFVDIMDNNIPLVKDGFCRVSPTHTISLSEIAETVKSFHNCKDNYFLPNISTDFNKKLYSTYLSYLPSNNFSYEPKINSDDRGSFTELFKTMNMGQVSVTITKPGIQRGNHWHNTKIEKFVVISGEGEIHLRNVIEKEVIIYKVNATHIQIVDIPPGYTHSIVNNSNEDLITLIWTNELLDKENPDTNFLEVHQN